MKKRFMRMISMLMVLVMTLGMCVTGYAADDYTITITNSVKDETYNAYKVFDVTYNSDKTSYSYTISASSKWYSLVSGEDSPFDLTAAAGQTGTYVVSLKEDKNDTDVINWFNGLYGNSALTGMEYVVTGTGTGSELVLDVSDYGDGYYFVTSSYGAIVSLTTTSPTAEIIEKNNKPGQGGDGFTKVAGNGTDDHSYSMGDTVPYTITAYVPTYSGDKEVLTYTITDTMGKGLIYNEDITVSIDGETLTKDTDYTVETSTDSDGNTVLTITWEPGKIENYPANGNITIKYTATIDEKADEIDLENSATLAWYTDDGEEPEDSTTTTEHIYTYGFDLKKIDGSTSTEETPTTLDGAKFTLQKQGSSELISFIYDEESNTYEVWDNQTLTSGQTTTTEIEVINGEVNIWGLGIGTYILTETEAPAGYNLLDSTVTIIISENIVTDDDGNVTSASWTVAVDEETNIVGTGTIDTTSDHGVTGDAIPEVTIENNAGSSLPSTGGIGTTIFYVVGTLLVLAAAALVVAKVRLGKTE